MTTLWAVILVVTNLVWLALTLILLPGNWIMVTMTLLVAWWRWDERMFSPWTLVAIVALAALGEVVEFLSSALGVKRVGGTKWSSLSALAGAIVGAIAGTFLIPIPVLGSLVGACGGACAAAWALETAQGRDAKRAAKSGIAAGAGHLVGTGTKFAIGVVIWLIIAVAAFWP